MSKFSIYNHHMSKNRVIFLHFSNVTTSSVKNRWYLPVSQFEFTKGFAQLQTGQIQVYELNPSMQVPPLWQGELAQSSLSTTIFSEDIFLMYFQTVLNKVITAHQRSCGKVIFSVVYVSLFTVCPLWPLSMMHWASPYMDPPQYMTLTPALQAPPPVPLPCRHGQVQTCPTWTSLYRDTLLPGHVQMCSNWTSLYWM